MKKDQEKKQDGIVSRKEIYWMTKSTHNLE